MAIRTHGLTHVALAVRDPQRAFQFYERLLGARLLAAPEGPEQSDLAEADWIEFGIPGSHDVITLTRADGEAVGSTGSLAHFGFRLVAAEDPDTLAAAVEAAGGSVISSGRFPSSGGPFVFARDPDGYEVELWFEEDAGWRASET